MMKMLLVIRRRRMWIDAPVHMAVERRVSCEVVWKKQSQKAVIVIIGNPAMRRRGRREENEEDEVR